LKHTAAIVKNLVNAGLTTQGIIHLQTNDTTTLENISRPKIQERYVEGFKNIFEEQGLPLAADLIIGLPGATMASLQGDLQYCFDRDILARPYALYILPNSRLAEPTYRRQFAVEADETGRVCSTASYSREDRQRMKFLHDLYQWFEGRGLLRYVLRHLQWDYAIPALDFIRQFISHLQEFPESCPCVRLGEEFSLAPEVQAGNWGLFYRELAAYILAHYDVRDDAAFRTAFAVNAAAMPRPGRKFPETITLAHDYVGYFLHNRSCAPEDRRRLSQYPAGEFTTTDPHGLCGLDIYHCRQWDAHQFFWELDSPIARKSSAPHFTYAPTIIPGDL
jgi:hypothetical protein